MNRLLRRQLERHNVDINAVQENIKNLLLNVNDSYFHSEKERQLIERTMDISSQELNMANRELRKKQKRLEDYNEELKQFSYITAHDLKEPLRTIGSFIRLVERREKNLSEESKEFIQMAVKGAERMKDLLDDLLKYTLIDSPNKENTKSINLNDVLRVVCLNLNTKIIETDTKVNLTNLPQVIGDRTQLVLLFQNLIDNSIKFRKSEIPKVDILSDNTFQDGFTKISVIDNGIGIESDFQSKVFSIFEKLHDTTTYQGTGIGLAICKKIVEKHAGKLWVDPHYSNGLKLDFTLPLCEI